MRILLAFLTAAVMGLPSCALMQSAELPAAPAVTPIEKAQAAINEANLLITASAHVLEANRKAEIITDAEYWDMGMQLVGYAKDVDNAQAALRMGEDGAAGQADILKNLITSLHRKIAEKARQKP